MNNDDSVTDCDEVFSLYSSKKVIETFKAQLKKIAANSCQLRKPCLEVNSEELCAKNNEKKEVSCIKKSEEALIECIEVPDDDQTIVSAKRNDVLEDSIEILEDVTPRRVTRQSSRLRRATGASRELRQIFSDSSNTSVIRGRKRKNVPDDDQTIVPAKRNDFLEDSIEILEDVTPRRVTRQSSRLRRATGASRELCQIFSDSFNSSVIRGRKRKKKGKKQVKGKPIEVTLDDSPVQIDIDELNPEFTVKVIWKSINIKKFQIRKFQKLSYIFEQLSKEENIPEEKVMLTFNNIRISRNDTPDSLNMQVYHFLDGGVLSELSNLCQTPESQKVDFDYNSVTLKFQDINKKIVKLSLHKNEKMKVAMIKCSEQLEIPLSRIRFFIDGELLNSSETPESLGLENEEVIDIKIAE